ncbi:MAG: hypothetical protein ABEJ86_03675 [Halococcoides sp.]
MDVSRRHLLAGTGVGLAGAGVVGLSALLDGTGGTDRPMRWWGTG